MTTIPVDVSDFFTLSARLSVYLYSLLVFLSAWGWSKQVNELLGTNTCKLSLDLLQGFCVLIGLVGFCAAFQLAYPSVLGLLLLIGLGFFVRHGRLSAWAHSRGKLNSFHWIIGATLAGLILYNFETQFPSFTFNYHDDFEKYFTYPKRLLQTGTLNAGPLNALGTETLGASAALQALILMLFPMPFINGADASWGMVLVYLLVLAPFRPETKNIPCALTALLLVTFLYLYYANVSALYMGLALLLGMLLLYPRMSGGHRHFFFLGAFYSTAVTLKPTFAIFIAIHAILMTSHLARQKGLKVTIQRYFLWTLLGAGVFLAPWIILHCDNYFLLVLGKGSSFSYNAELIGKSRIAELSILFYRPYLTFTILTILCWLLPLLSLRLSYNKELPTHVHRDMLFDIAFGGLLTCVYIVFILVGPFLNGSFMHLRYFAPSLAALFFYIFATYTASEPTCVSRGLGYVLRAMPVLAALLLFVVGGRIAMQIQQELMETGSMHYFSHLTSRKQYREYTIRTAWSSAEQERIARAQAAVPEGEPILAWLNANFLLDYNRNQIFDVDPAGIASPWAYVPDVQYFIWQSQGYGVRSKKLWYSRFKSDAKREKVITLKCMQFLKNMTNRINRAEILYSDGEIYVAKVR